MVEAMTDTATMKPKPAKARPASRKPLEARIRRLEELMTRLNAKKAEIEGLQTRRSLLQTELQHATPQQKAAIVAEIGATNDAIADAEAEVPALQAVLDACIARHGGHLHDAVGGTPVVVDPG